MSVDPVFELINVLPQPLILIGADERILHTNEPARALLEIDGQGRHYITGLRQPQLLDAIEQCFKIRASSQSRYLGTEGGRDTTWKVTVSSTLLGSSHGVVLIFEDITAMEQAGKMRRDFVTNVSHEMRTPLTALLGFVETLKGPAKDDEAARTRFLDIMEREAGRMAHLVDDLLSLSRVEEDERVRPQDNVDIVTVVHSVIDLLSSMAKNAGLDIHYSGPVDPLYIAGDEDQLTQVVSNLVQNAIKYGASGQNVYITIEGPENIAALRSNGIRLGVKDEGEGIAAHHIARLTERFYRVDTHRSREIGGTGLGLAIVKHIINRHRGRLRITSELGQGAEFKVLLPIE